ncbi:MAG: GntR family transcriptional regulator [Reyranellaceae bacterium]
MRVNGKARKAPAVPAGPAFAPLGEATGAPLHEVVKRRVSEAILVGEWRPGTVLPSEVALAAMFGVAVGTARRALTDLTAEGMLSRRRKTGTVVTGRTPHHSLRFFFHYFRLHDREGGLVRSTAKVLSVGMASANDAERCGLRLGRGVEVVRVDRLRLVAGKPVMRDRLSLPATLVPEFPTTPAHVPELLFLHLVERYGIRISAVREQITATVADAEDLRLLKLRRPAALLVIDEVAYDQSGTPVLLGAHRAVTKEHCYVNEVR